MAARYESIDQYVRDAVPAPLQDAARQTSAIIDECMGADSGAIKWSHPTWSVGADPVCYLKTASAHLTFGFWHGASIDDPSGRLEGGGKRMAHVKLKSPDDIDPGVFRNWIDQAVSIAKR